MGEGIIINGAYQVAQRGTSSTSQGASEGYKTVDRWNYTVGEQQQQVDLL